MSTHPVSMDEIAMILRYEIIPNGRNSLVFDKRDRMEIDADQEGLHAHDTLTGDYFFEPVVEAYCRIEEWGAQRVAMYLTGRMVSLVNQINSIPGTTDHPIPSVQDNFFYADTFELFKEHK